MPLNEPWPKSVIMVYPYKCPECGRKHTGGPAGGDVCSACAYPNNKGKAFEQAETVAEVGIFSKKGDPVSTSRNVVMFDKPVTFHQDDVMIMETDYEHKQIRYKFPDGSVQVTPISTEGRMWTTTVRNPKPSWCPLWLWRMFDKRWYIGVGTDG